MSEWISVKDRLPEELVRVLLLVEVHYVNGGRGYYICIAYLDDGCWYERVCNYDEDFAIGDFEKYWMPLPEPPEVE